MPEQIDIFRKVVPFLFILQTRIWQNIIVRMKKNIDINKLKQRNLLRANIIIIY